MTKTVLDPALYLLQQLAELDVKLKAVDHTDNQGEPCAYCEDWRRPNSVTLHGFDGDGEALTADCCAHCAPLVVTGWFSQLHVVCVQVAR